MSNTQEFERTSISLEIPILEHGKEKARSLRQSFSAYVATLIESDLSNNKGRRPIRRSKRGASVIEGGGK